MNHSRIIIDDKPIEFVAGDSVLVAMLRSNLYPTDGGCLCLAGDCSHCVATVDGISYVRTCQVAARPGMMIKAHPRDGYPLLPTDERLGAPVASVGGRRTQYDGVSGATPTDTRHA